jgi:hypothetical protein
MTDTLKAGRKYYSSRVPRMDPDLKKEWVEALRSGEYLQGKQYLKTVARIAANKVEVLHCCLGVICELIPTVDENHAMQINIREFGGNHNTGTLPMEAVQAMWPDHNRRHLSDNPTVFSAVGLSESAYVAPLDDPEIYGKMYSLAELNDQGFTFNQIADVIDYFL